MAKRRRLFLRTMLSVVAVAVAALAAVPWWLPWVVRMAAPLAGVSIGGHRTEGWRSVTFESVAWAGPGASVEADAVAVSAWLFAPTADSRDEGGAGAPAAIRVSGVRVRLGASDAVPRPAGARGRVSVPALFAQVKKGWRLAARWLPSTLIEDLSVSSGRTEIVLPEIRWDGRSVRGTVRVPEATAQSEFVLYPDRESGEGAAGSGGDLRLEASVRDWDVQLELAARATEAAAEVEGEVRWQGNLASVSAAFAGEGVLPARAIVEAASLSVEAASLGIDGYGPLRGMARLEWTEGHFGARLSVAADPLETGSALPQVAVDLRAAGGLESVRIEAVDVRLPGVLGTLSEPIRFDPRSGRVAAAGRFAVSVELEAVPWLDALGKLAGTVDVEPAEDGLPRVTFVLAGHDLAWEGRAVEAAELAGELAWPRLRVETFSLLLPGEGQVAAHGVVDLAQRSIENGEVEARCDTAALAAVSPDGPPVRSIEARARVSGALARPEHVGTVHVRGLESVPGAPVDGDLEWAATGWESAAVAGEVRSAAGVRLPIELTVTRDTARGMRALLQLKRLAWHDADGEWWTLVAPAAGYIEMPADGGPPRLEISGLEMRGETLRAVADVDVVWPLRGEVSVDVAGVRAGRFGALVPEALAAVVVDELRFDARWDEGPVVATGRLRGGYRVDERHAYSVEVDFEKGGTDQVTGSVRVFDNASGLVAMGEGVLPVALAGGAEGMRLRLLRDAPLRLDLDSQANDVFWDSIRDLLGWGVLAPEVDARIEGTLAEPRGHLLVRAEALVPPPREGSFLGRLPELRDVRIEAEATADGIVLEEASLMLDGRRIELQGGAPWTVWQDGLEAGRVPWERGRFRLRTDPLPLAIAARVVPELIVPEGELRLDLRHEPETGFAGTVRLENASLRPIEPLGTVREIEGEMVVRGYEVELSRLKAEIGGRLLEVAGRAVIRPGEQPEFDVRIRGDRVPLVRSAGLILRAGMDLQVTRGAEGPARITGRITPGPSVFFSDLASMIGAGGAASPETRPPYFSVQVPGLADWQLDVEVFGERFLQLDVPALRGRVSVDFRLEGTLAAPRAIGRATLHDGVVAFPFASMPLESAEVTLLASDPFTPRLHAIGAGRIYGYDLRMEVSGTAADPQIRFSGDPPISSRDALLMLTAGELPRSSEHAFSTTVRAQRLALYMGRTIVSGLGLSDVGVESRINVRSSERFTERGRETFYVQFDLDHRWSLVGEYDRWDAYNGGIKFRVLER